MIFFLLLFSVCLIAQTATVAYDGEYDIKNIPLQLMQNTGAVIRTDETRFEISDYRNVNMKVKYAVTIFDKSNQNLGKLKLWYDNLKTIEDLEGFIYDSNGNLVRELKDSDIEDYSNFASYSIYSDTRVKYISLYYDRFPYTVEYIYEISYDGYLNWPTWYSRNSLDPVVNSTFEVVTPEDFDLRYWCNSDDVQPDITTKDGDKIYYWREFNLQTLSSDIFGSDFENYATIVRIAPADFEVEGYRGNMESWKAFGLWYFNLLKGRDVLPETAIQEINKKIESSTEDQEKIEILYDYLQSKTRYVSVQLGIGKWQPFDASYVYQNGYGDCKALTNYMISILKSAGINAYAVLINSGDDGASFIADFPSNQFNHVIVTVPLKKDTIWLECTSQILPPGSISWNNENREALMITPQGGVIVRTPVSNSIDNLQIIKCELKLASTGNADVKSKVKWSGNQHIYPIYIAENLIPEEQEKWIKNLLEVPGINLTNYSFSYKKEIQQEVDLQLEISLPRYASITGSRIFFNPNLMNRRTNVPKEVTVRVSPVEFDYPYLDIDSIYYVLPDDYKIEAVPKETNIQSSFGNFTSRTIKNDDSTIIFFRSLEIKDYQIPAENYTEYRNFFSDVVKADKQQVVLVKESK